jgi:hypothetical protein
MPVLRRLLGRPEDSGRPHGLAADARAMRRTLSFLHAEEVRVNGPSAPVDLRAMVRDLLEGEVEAPTPDVAALVREEVDPEAFYSGELAPSWEGLDETSRARRLEGFLELSTLVDEHGDAAGVPAGMAANVHTRTLILAWAFDETYGYLSRLGRGDTAGWQGLSRPDRRAS